MLLLQLFHARPEVGCVGTDYVKNFTHIDIIYLTGKSLLVACRGSVRVAFLRHSSWSMALGTEKVIERGPRPAGTRQLTRQPIWLWEYA